MTLPPTLTGRYVEIITGEMTNPRKLTYSVLTGNRAKVSSAAKCITQNPLLPGFGVAVGQVVGEVMEPALQNSCPKVSVSTS